MTITNVMRLLKQANIPFETSEYEVDESDLSGVHAAQMLGIDYFDECGQRHDCKERRRERHLR